MMRPVKKDRGAILIMTAFILVILIGIAAFALDLGRLYVLRTEMQNAVDAAAISAAAELNGNAGDRAKAELAANQEMLNHLSHFSRTNNQLLQDLPAVNFIFYSWIGSSADGSPPSGCTVNEKCVTISDDDASYVQITLKPADDKSVGPYAIDLYFLPVLNLFGDVVDTTASTQVVALAGSHNQVCNYPPMFICDPTEAGGETLSPGDMILLKQHSTGGTIVDGGFGWLMPGYSEEDPYDDDLNPNSPELFARRLGSKYPQDCAPPIVKVNTGNVANPTSIAMNTRFGLYPSNFTNKYLKEDFPSAPNVIDYPRDSELTVDGPPKLNDNEDCVRSDTERFGQGGWGVSLCNKPGNKKQPSTFSRADYNSSFFTSPTTPPYPAVPGKSRYEYYQEELSSGKLPESNLPSSTVLTDERQCNNEGKGKCRMLDGDPRHLAPVAPSYIDDSNVFKRRELFVAMVRCGDLDVGASNPIVNLGGADTHWMKFFLTEHVGDPSMGVDVYAEFIGEAIDKDEHFKKVIQLYE